VTATLTSLRQRVAQSLLDSGGLVWTSATLDEALRQALAAYNLPCGGGTLISGLDGAQQTTLPVGDETLLVQGAAAIAAFSRAVWRTESVELGSSSLVSLMSWAGQQGVQFAAGLERVRRRGLMSSLQPPYAPVVEGE
jgi:hypothetical protein